MCFSVQAVTIAHTFGAVPDQLKTSGEVYVVTVRLRSAARRTAQKPSQPRLFVVDAQGKRYSQIINAGNEIGLPIDQPVTAAQLWNRKIQPGESVSRMVALDLPAGIHQPGLVISGGFFGSDDPTCGGHHSPNPSFILCRQ